MTLLYYAGGEYIKPPENPLGILLLVGGGENHKEGAFPTAIARIAGKPAKDVRVLFINSASELPIDAPYLDKYMGGFSSKGYSPDNLIFSDPRDRRATDALTSVLATVDVVYFTGGSQEMLLERVGKTRFHEQLYDFYKNGGIVGGSSAGCSALSSVMIIRGYAENDIDYYEKGIVDFGAGLGLTNIIADQHFSKRNRLARLQVAVGRNYDTDAPLSHIGIGVDENTMVIVHPGNILEVVGSASATILYGLRPDKLLANRQRYDQTAEGDLLLDAKRDFIRGHSKIVLWNRMGFDLTSGQVLSPEALQARLTQVHPQVMNQQNTL